MSIAHAESRGGLGSGQRLLRYASGRPVSARRYDYLWGRLGEHLPWVKTQNVSMHWIRHTILTWVERRSGFAVAQATQAMKTMGEGLGPWRPWPHTYALAVTSFGAGDTEREEAEQT